MIESISKLIGSAPYDKMESPDHIFYYVPDAITPYLKIKIVKESNSICCWYYGHLFYEKDFEKLCKLRIFV